MAHIEELGEDLGFRLLVEKRPVKGKAPRRIGGLCCGERRTHTGINVACGNAKIL